MVTSSIPSSRWIETLKMKAESSVYLDIFTDPSRSIDHPQ